MLTQAISTFEANQETIESRLAAFEQFTTIRFPIYIPSRGRPNHVLIANQFDDDNIHYTIVVEPQDYAAYRTRYSAEQLLVLDKDNGGVAYVRNFIKDHAASMGHRYHWQFDDNVRSFAIRRNGKALKARPMNAISFIESIVFEYKNIGGINFSNGAYAFGYDKKPMFRMNNQIYCAMLLNTEPFSRFRAGIHEDTDYSLQLLDEGWSTLVCNRVVMTKTHTMTMRGGNTDTEYANGGRKKRFENLAAAWPRAEFKVVERNGIWTVRPSRIWRTFTQRPEPIN